LNAGFSGYDASLAQRAKIPVRPSNQQDERQNSQGDDDSPKSNKKLKSNRKLLETDDKTDFADKNQM